MTVKLIVIAKEDGELVASIDLEEGNAILENGLVAYLDGKKMEIPEKA